MNMRRGAFATLAFSVFASGTVGCGSSGDGVSNRRLDSGNPATPDATHVNPDAGAALTPDAPWLAPDSLVTPDRPVVVADSDVKSDVLWPPSDTVPLANPDSTPDVSTSAKPDVPLFSPDTAISQGPDAGLAVPDSAFDSALTTSDTNGSPADAAVQSGKTVTFSQGRAVGAMIDWGWVSGGNSAQGGGNSETPLTTFTQPVCPTGAGALTGFGQSCSDTQWPTANALCMSGSIPALTACVGGLATVATTAGPVTAQCMSDETMDYGEDWGAMVGVQATPEKKSTITFIPTSIAATYTGAPASRIRLMIVIDSISYCSLGAEDSYISGTAVTAAGFSTRCWTTGGAAPASLAGIQKVILQIDSKTTPVEFNNFCFTGIVFE